MSNQRKTLASNIVPQNYQITINASLKTFTYVGDETITITIAKPTCLIRLNSSIQEIKSASITSNGKIQHATIVHNQKEELLSLEFPSKVNGHAILSINFEGKTGDNPRGFYRSRYVNNGKTGYILTTQFEPVDARSAFPCFDEPAMKATFNISFIIDKELQGISNMPIIRETTLKDGKKQLFFDTTPRMSTYLVYFGIGDFVIASRKLGKRTVRVISTPDNAKKGELAFKFAKLSLDFYERYFGINYPLPKVDLLGIPDFSGSTSAMENWGAITFRSVELLADRKTVSVSMKRRMMQVVAHELAHQWFGNLVTMRWWDDLWLNESFATFMEGKTQETIFPQWKSRQERLVTDTSRAMGEDQLLSTHPINVEVNNPNEIGEIFDAISYYKGCPVIGMIEDYAGNELFRKGIQFYMSKHRYGNASKEDLWSALASTSKKSSPKLVKVARAWVDYAGFPIVEADGPINGVVTLKQSRFTVLPYKGEDKIWPIPIRYLTSEGEGFFLMEGKTAKLKVGPSVKFIKLNYDQVGFYRVKYGPDNLKALGEAIKHRKLSGTDAWGIVSDLSNLTRACLIKVTDVLDFINNYCLECEYPLNLVISAYLSGLMLRFESKNPTIYKRARDIAMIFNRSILSKTGWVRKENEDNSITLLRSYAIRGLAECADAAVLSHCKKLLDDYLRNGKEIDVNLKATIYVSNAIRGNEVLFNKFLALYKKQNGGEEIMRLSAALGSFRDKSLNLRALKFTMSNYVRSQDKDYIAAYVSNSPTGQSVIFSWLKDNWHNLRKIYGNDVGGLGRFFEELDTTSDKSEKKKILRFVNDKSNHLNEIKRSVNKTLESIEINIRFVDYNS